MPEARVAAMPPMVALAPGSTEKNRPLPRRCLLSCSRVTPACTVASRSPVLTCKIRFICERSRLTPPLRGCLKSRLRVTDHRGVMPITINTDKLYDTDLTDAAWALIGPMLPAARRGGRPRTTNIRAVLNAIFFLLRTGCQWRLLPREFPVWSTVYHYFRV